MSSSAKEVRVLWQKTIVLVVVALTAIAVMLLGVAGEAWAAGYHTDPDLGTTKMYVEPNPADTYHFGDANVQGRIRKVKFKNGNEAMAFCVNPRYGGPNKGKGGWCKAKVLEPSDMVNDDAYRALVGAIYYSVAGPGAEKGKQLMPRTGWDGVALDDVQVYAQQHVLMGYYYNRCNWQMTFAGLKDPFAYESPGGKYTAWFQSNMLPGSGGTWSTANTWGSKVIALTDDEHMYENGGYTFDQFAKEVYVIMSGAKSNDDWGFQDLITWKQGGGGGELMLQKRADAGLRKLVADNPAYSLENAQYAMYTDESVASEIDRAVETGQVTQLSEAVERAPEGQLVFTFITDEDGYSDVLGSDGKALAEGSSVPPGSYFVVEIVPSQGFSRAPGALEVTVEAGKSKVFKADEPPQGGVFKIRKVDANTGKPLGGAEFKVRWETENYDPDADEPQGVAKTWKLKSDENGWATFDDEHLLSGTLPKLGNEVLLPFGSYTVTETKAPDGYDLPDNTVKGPYTVKNYAGFERLAKNDYAAFTYADPPKLGHVSLEKVDADTGKASPQGKAALAGAVFDVTLKSTAVEGAKVIDVSGNDVAVNGLVCQITTDALGKASTSSLSWPKAQQGLPYGTYRITESKASPGYKLPDGWHADVVVNKESNPLSTPVKEPVMRGNLSVVKVDSEIGEEQGDAGFRNTLFDIINDSENAVLSPQYGVEVPPGGVVCKIVTDADGKASTTRSDLNGWSIPSGWNGKALAYGKYKVKETAPPTGYNPNAEWTGEAQIVVDEVDPQAEVIASDPVKRYGIAVAKYDYFTAKSNPQGDAKMDGTRFQVINMSKGPVKVNGAVYPKGSVVAEIVAKYDEEYKRYVAKTAADTLPYGTYKVKEIAAPEGYFNNTLWEGTCELHEGDKNGKVIDFTMQDASVSDVVKRGNIELEKDDAQRASGKEQGDATLSGAVYDIVNRSENAVLSPQYGAEVAPGGVVCKIVTDADGKASTTRSDLNGWSIPESWEGKALAYGTYEVVESKESKGYNINATWKGVAVIRNDGEAKRLKTTEDVERGMLKVGKVSRENGRYHEQGAASLQEWAFEVVNMSAEPVVLGRDGSTEVAHGEVVTTITTKKVGDKYIAQTAADALPYGTYEVHEIQTMRPQDNGYLFDGESQAWSKTFTIRDEGQVVDYTNERDAESNQVVRGDFSFNKKAAPSMKPLAKVPFKVTSLTTKEWHIVLTDNNGEVDTSSSNYKHTNNANANDKALKSDGTVDESKLDYEAGVWFSGSAVYAVSPDDSRGALVFDTYKVEELRCAANEGYGLVEFEVSIKRDGKAVNLGTVDDNKDIAPQVATTLTDYEGGKIVAAKSDATLIDTVTFNNLEKDEPYKLIAKLYRVADGALGDKIAEVESPFKPRTSHGTTDVEIGLDTSALSGHSVVCCEYLYDKGGSLIASHEDPADEGQTVRVPSIDTNLTDDATESHYAASANEGVIELTDTVTFEGLMRKKTYTVKGVLMDKETGEPVVDAEGNVVSAEQSFTPKTESGTVELPFKFKDPGLAGRAVVAFETVEYRGVEYAVHADINDDEQTVYIPAISTTFADETTGLHTVSEMGKAKFEDSVAYENLEPGREYTLSATLMSKGNSEPVRDAAGNTLTSAVTFRPTSPSGTVKVPFEIDASNLAPAAVCFERLFAAEGVVAATHEDIADEEQTVYVPSIATVLTEKATGFHSITQTGEVELVDTVTYEGLEPGREYTMSAKLVDKGSGQELKDAEGGEIVSEVKFTPEKRDGEVEVAFTVASNVLRDAAVCFEKLYDARGTVAATHEDLTDEDQTIYVPSIATTASDPRTATHAVADTGVLKLDDLVSFKGLEPGAEYKLAGVVHVRNADGTDAGALKDDEGEEVTAEVVLMPEDRDGTAKMAFKANVSDLAGKTLVVFESLTHADAERPVAAHEDISDERQTVYVPAIKTTAVDKLSGSHYAASTGTVQITDTVSYENLVAGIEYTVSGELHGVSADGADAGPVMDAECNPVTASQKFVPEGSAGTVEVAFEFDPKMAPADVVVFEWLVVTVADGHDEDGNEMVHEQKVAQHADITDESQTVSIARIATTAADERTSEHMAVLGEDVRITDSVAFEGLEPGAEYCLTGEVHVRGADGSDAGTLKGADGKPVSAELKFQPEKGNGSVEMRFSADVEPEPGTALVVFETLKDSRGNEVASHADIADEAQTVTTPKISTNAVDKETGSHYAGSMMAYTVVDKVTYEGLVVGKQYTMEGTLHAVSEEGEDLGPVIGADGSDVIVEKRFVPAESDGAIELEFDVDPAWMPARAVAFEKCGLVVDGEIIPVAGHEDPADENQTVRTAKIATTLTEKEGASHVLTRIDDVQLVDTVAYEGLEPGQAYLLDATLVNKTTSRSIRLADGNEASATVEFKPEASSGTVKVPLSVDVSELPGEAVCFERLSRPDGKVVAHHEDINDESQTVRKPEIATTATDVRTGNHTGILSTKLAVKDAVEYKRLEPGTEYKMVGVVHLRNADGSDAGALEDASGKTVGAEMVFTPEEEDGTISLTFQANMDDVTGKTLVVFEELVNVKTGTVAARHADISDESQAVYYPAIATTATVKANKTHYAGSTKEFTIVDEVQYRGLQVGADYVMVGMLHAVGEDGADGGIVRDAEGAELTATKKFKPKSSDGSVKVEFKVNPAWMPSRVVAFEQCGVMVNGVFTPVAKHEDPTDENQTVRMAQVVTHARDKASGKQLASADAKATVVDVVSYEGLEVGREYTVAGKLMDKATGKSFEVSGKEASNTTTFTPKAPDGEVEIEFEIEGKALNGHDLVVFERLSDNEGKVVAVHEDINNKAQTVSYRKPGLDTVIKQAGDVFDKTGYWLARHLWLIVAAGLFLVVVGALRYMANDEKSPFNDSSTTEEIE